MAKLFEKPCHKDHDSRVIAILCDGRLEAKFCDKLLVFRAGRQGVLDRSVEYLIIIFISSKSCSFCKNCYNIDVLFWNQSNEVFINDAV